MKVIVGLGNPGRKYQGTRHNIGFDVLNELANRHQASPSRLAHEAEVKEINLSGEKTLLVAPQTYMNLSGRSVGSLVRFFKLSCEQVIIVCDDLNLPLGKLRFRANGSSGGQKGLKDIISHLGTEEVPRLRLGIGRANGRMDISQYVLQKFGSDDQEEVTHTIQQAADGLEAWVSEGIEPVMTRFNANK
ncbi:MAG: aminoacyl-tRNA hydrolase [Planctomycetaceae bacterium]|nr:aminoacyl-tRNA hydrolase [Planctomycetaceae bacterium]